MSTAKACVSLQDSPDLLLLLRLLALGQGAWDMIDSQVFKEPKMVTGSGGLLPTAFSRGCGVGFGEEDGPQAHVREDERRKGAEGQGRCRTALGPLPQEVELVTRFLPTLMSFVVDDHAFNVDQKLPAEEKAPVSYPSALPETFTKYGLRALGGRAFPSGSLGADGARAQVPAGAARGLRGGAVLRVAHHQAEEQERAPAPAPGSR